MESETVIIQNIDAAEQNLKQSSNSTVSANRSSGSVTCDARKTNVLPMDTTHMQTATTKARTYIVKIYLVLYVTS